jgi:TonB family protein
MNMRSLFLIMAALAAFANAAEAIKPPADDPQELSFDRSRPATAMEWAVAEYPADLKAAGEKAAVRVRFVVDKTGAVTEPEAIGGDERFYVAAVAAIQKWRYDPARRKGQPVPESREVRVTFDPAPPKGRSKILPPYTEEESPERPPLEKNNPEPDYPGFLESRRLSGEVALSLAVNETGRVVGVAVHESSHPDFLMAALATVSRWEFQPAMQGRLPIPGRKEASLQFSVASLGSGLATGVDWLEHNGIFLREPAGTKTQDYFDGTPEALVMVDPVYPAELLRAGITGGARVNFTVSLRGEVIDVSVDEATAPEFGAAVAAAIGSWRFKPLRRAQEVVGGQFSFTWKFTAPRAEGHAQRLIAMRERGEAFAGPRQLDRPPEPLFLRAPVHPAVYLGTDSGAGNADVEVIIDRDGRVCLPRVVAASKPEFGWAAATAVSQWCFATPRKDGQPVDVRAVIPVEFPAR